MVVKCKVLITLIIIVVLVVGIILLKSKKTAILSYTSIIATPVIKKTPAQLLALPLILQANRNFLDTSVQFRINNDTLIDIRSIGEGADHNINPFLFKSYENDGVEVYFDMKNEKKPFFDIHRDDRQYRVLWKSLKIDGQNINTEGLKVIERDPDNNSYIILIKFPWKYLGYIIPRVGVKIGFDIALIDCDGGTRKALLTWNSTSEDSWKNTSFYGVLKLVTRNSTAKPSMINCLYTLKRPGKKIDQDPVWRTSQVNRFNNVTIGTVKDSSDLSGIFKALWDNENLYLLVKVRDNIKTYAKAMFDYGSIEDLNGKIIWKMDMQGSKPAGGALKNRLVDTIIKIKAGNYYLKYKTDESHSPTQWDSPPPNGLFYGIKINYK